MPGRCIKWLFVVAWTNLSHGRAGPLPLASHYLGLSDERAEEGAVVMHDSPEVFSPAKRLYHRVSRS